MLPHCSGKKQGFGNWKSASLSGLVLKPQASVIGLWKPLEAPIGISFSTGIPVYTYHTNDHQVDALFTHVTCPIQWHVARTYWTLFPSVTNSLPPVGVTELFRDKHQSPHKFWFSTSPRLFWVRQAVEVHSFTNFWALLGYLTCLPSFASFGLTQVFPQAYSLNINTNISLNRYPRIP